MTFIALLRAINLGNHRSLAMSALRDFIADLSFTDARTLLQTGNKVPRSLMSRGSKRISFIQPASADHASLTRLSKRCLALAPQVGTGIPSQKLAGLAAEMPGTASRKGRAQRHFYHRDSEDTKFERK